MTRDGRVVDVDIAFDGFVVGAAEVQVVVVDELCGDFDERDISGKAAVVPPVGLQGGDTVGDAGVVDGEDDEVFAVFEDAGDLAVEGSEAALVLADFFRINPDEDAVVGGAEVEERADLRLRGVLETLFIPDGAFVVEKLGTLIGRYDDIMDSLGDTVPIIVYDYVNTKCPLEELFFGKI